MCSSKAPDVKPPEPVQPPDEKRIELNPETASKKAKSKKLGTKRLQIPLKQPGIDGSGLKV